MVAYTGQDGRRTRSNATSWPAATATAASARERPGGVLTAHTYDYGIWWLTVLADRRRRSTR